MNTERNPHLLNDRGGVIGSSTPIHGYGSPPGGSGVSDMAVGTPCPVPTPPWVKPPSNNGNSGMMTPESDVSSCSSPASTSYGASSQQQTFPPQTQQQNQHLLQQHRSYYGSSSASFSNSSPSGNTYCNNSNAISSSTNCNSGMFYDSSGEVMDQNQYYQHHHHQQQQQHHFHQQQFQNSMQHLQQKSGSSNNSPNLIDNNNLTGDCVDHGGGSGNFYGFYNSNSGQYSEYNHSHHQQQQHHHQHHNHQQQDNNFSSSGDGNSVRMNQFYHNHHRQDGSASGNNVPVGHSNYFNSSGVTTNYPNSSQGTATPPTRYGSPMVFPQQNHGNTNNSNNYGMHQHHQNHAHMQGQIPLRRNSIESYSSEPGSEGMHSSYAARFGGNAINNNSNCSSSATVNNNNMGHMQQQLNHHNSHHHTQNNQFSGSTTPGEPVVVVPSGMVKREQCSGMTSRSSPSMNPMTPNPGCWSPHPPQTGGGGYFPSSSPNNSCSSSGSPNPCSSSNNNNPNNANTNRTNFINSAYSNQGGCAGGGSESSNCTGNFYHQPVPTTQFKSCAYEQSQQHHDIKEGISPLKAASAVKHRSLSLSMPLPSYMENNRDTSNFANHAPHRPLSSHHSHLHNNNHHFNPAMMDTTQHHHHHHHCSTSVPGLVPPPEQNLLTPNSDDDIPFRAASAGGQSDLDSCYETMGDEGCSSTSTSVASHCMSSTGSMNTSGSSSCSGGAGMMENSSPVAIASTTSDHNLHPMPMDHSDCHHHHHQHDLGGYPTPSSCMQSHHPNVPSSMHHPTMEMIEIPNSTVALCTNNVDDLDDSSSDSDSVELHNVISAVVENSSIETPENTMMGDEGMDDGQMDLQDSQNVISTTTNEPEEQDNDGEDDDDDDNCSESSMSHINSSFTADMFNDNSLSNQNEDGNCEDFPCISEEGNFIDDEEDDDDDDDDAEEGNNIGDEDVTNEPATTSADILLSNSSSELPCSSSPQKILKRSYSEADKDILTVNTTMATTTSSLSLSCSPVGSISTFSFGASFGKMKGESGESSSRSSGIISASQNDKDQHNNNKINNNNKITDKCEDKSVKEISEKVQVNSAGDKSTPIDDGGDNEKNALRRKGTGGCKAVADIISSSTLTNDENGSQVSIPKGWKREILKGVQGNENGSNGTVVLYISPSDTKIRNLDELKNYIGSDGTCKCGLSCPLRLEVAFSFDPKVTNMTGKDEKENLKGIHAPTNSAPLSSKEFERNESSSSSSTSSSTSPTTDPNVSVNNTGESQDTRLLCNHKRKIPKAEDSPLISSTRDDLGDFGEKLKKRRLSGNECANGEKLVSSGGVPFRKDLVATSESNNETGGNNGSGSNNNGGGSINNSSSSTSNSSSSSSHNVPVPFCQQSPDTTTQTPQTEMSPASSVCSDSSTILFSSAGSTSSGNRSLTSTPTPTLSTSSGTSVASSASATSSQKVGSSPSQGPSEFVWPSVPPSTIIQQPTASPQIWLNPTPFSSGSNSLTLNYVQSVPNTGTLTTTASLTTTLPTTLAPIIPALSTPTTSSGPILAGANSAKKTYPHPYPAKTVKRPSSPCPNIDVSKLPLEQNRPPLILPPSPAPKIPTTLSPLLPTLGPSSITSTLPTLSTVVSNPNILFTVTPPLMAAGSTSTLPILPLLTTTGKFPGVGSLDTTCGPPTILTTLQQNAAALFSQIGGDTTTVTGTPFLSATGPLNSITTSVATSTPQKLVAKIEVTSNTGKKTDVTTTPNKEAATPGKLQGKDAKEPVPKVSSSAETTKSPLQLAQDIVSRFEKKSGEKDKEVARKLSDKSGKSEESSKEVKEKSASKSAKTTSKEPKDKVEEKNKANNAKEDNVPNKIKSDPAPVPSSTEQTKAGKEKEANKSETTNVVIKGITESGIPGSKGAITTSLSGEAESAKSSSPTIVTLTKEQSGSDIKVLKVTPAVDTSIKTPFSSCSTTIVSIASPIVASTTTPISSQLSHQLPENAIITSQTPVMSTTPLILKDGLLTDQGLTLTTSVSAPIPTISLSAMGNQIIQTSGGPVSCAPTIPTFGQLNSGANQFILQAPSGHQGHADHNNANSAFITTSTAAQPRFTTGPILQTIQPLFLNSTGPAGGPLIISQPTPSSQDPTQQQSFIYDHNGTPTATIDANGTFQQIVQPATTTMVLDPSGLCAGNPNLNSMAGTKKKKKRLSKKQQQQQAQLQLQQQFILQQIQAQQQAAAAAALAPLTIFPQSFNLGPQGFSLQPTMNFFPTPTILTLPNLILNPADGTLFIQPSTPLPTAAPTQIPQTTTMKLGQFPLQTTATVQASPNNPQNIAPKKDSGTGSPIIQEPLKSSSTPGPDPGSDDSRQNPTPDSSTNDLQLGLINVATGPTPQTNTITLNIPAQNPTTVLHNPSPVVQKKNSKNRTVSSSSANVKRILPQKQILPKIDSTTPSTTENAN